MGPKLAVAAGAILVCLSGCCAPPAEQAGAATHDTRLKQSGSPSTLWVEDILILFEGEEAKEYRERLVLGLIDFLIADAQTFHGAVRVGPARGTRNGSPCFSELELRSILFEHPEFWDRRKDDLLELGIHDSRK